MADDKKKKTKKDEPEEKRASTRRSEKQSAKRSGSNVFAMFTQRQIAEFKEAFQLMDHDKDGVIGKGDLKATYDDMGKSGNDREMDEMIGEATGPINFTMLLTLFGNRMSGGGGDDDEVVANAFKSFDNGGKIESDKLRHALMTWGEKFTKQEVDECFGQMTIDGGKIDTGKLIAMLTGGSAEGDEAA
jgi:Ca2+-binding EF-hand superfamily protein